MFNICISDVTIYVHVLLGSHMYILCFINIVADSYPFLARKHIHKLQSTTIDGFLSQR